MEKNKPFDAEKVMEATRLLLEGLGEDINRPGLIDTPKRVAKYWKELTEGSHYTNAEIADMFRKDFQVSFDPIVFKECKNIFSTCFNKDTRVLIPGNKYKLISKFKVGDYVRTFNPTTGSLEDKKVTYVHKNTASDWYKLRINNVTTLVTPEHPYFDENMNQIAAKDLTIGSKVWTLRNVYSNHTPIKCFNKNYYLGYILGTLLSDGSMWRNCLKLSVTEEWFADKFKLAIKEVFGLEAKKSINNTYGGFKESITMYTICIVNAQICSILSELCKHKYKCKDFCVPEIILDDFEIFTGFYEAYLDGDGSEFSHPRKLQKLNRLTSSNKSFIEFTAEIFERKYNQPRENIYTVDIPLFFNNRDTNKNIKIKFLEKFNKTLKNDVPTKIFADITLSEVTDIQRERHVGRTKHGMNCYNLEVEDNHTYIANGVWVHNCEHHTALMYNGTVYVSYVPTFWNGKDDTEGYRVIGLSKIPRIVDMCSKRLQLQEKFVADVAECIELATGSKEVYVEAIMDHACVSARGIKSSGVTETTYMSPALRKNVQTRTEIQNKVIISRSS